MPDCLRLESPGARAKVLFDSGKTDLKSNGKEALSSVAEVLKTIDKRHFQVARHTDNVPIQNSAFASNWELSCARALAAVHFLIAQGVSPGLLSAARATDVRRSCCSRTSKSWWQCPTRPALLAGQADLAFIQPRLADPNSGSMFPTPSAALLLARTRS